MCSGLIALPRDIFNRRVMNKGNPRLAASCLQLDSPVWLVLVEPTPANGAGVDFGNHPCSTRAAGHGMPAWLKHNFWEPFHTDDAQAIIIGMPLCACRLRRCPADVGAAPGDEQLAGPADVSSPAAGGC